MKRFALGLIVLLAGLSAGCGAAREAQMAAENAPTASVAGTWTGSAGTGGVSAPITLTLAQTGTNVSGTISVGGRSDLSGPVKGTVTGQVVKLSLASVTLGQMIAKDGTMSGEISGGLPATLRRAQ